MDSLIVIAAVVMTMTTPVKAIQQRVLHLLVKAMRLNQVTGLMSVAHLKRTVNSLSLQQVFFQLTILLMMLRKKATASVQQSPIFR